MRTTPIDTVDGFVIYDAAMPPNRGVLDPVTVLLRDFGGQGQIIVECFGAAWSHWFGAIGSKTLRQFLAGCDAEYLAGKLVSQTVRKPTKREEAYVLQIARAVIEAVKARAIEPRTPPKQLPRCGFRVFMETDDGLNSCRCGVELTPMQCDADPLAWRRAIDYTERALLDAYQRAHPETGPTP